MAMSFSMLGSDEQRELIKWGTEMEELFTGKRNAAIKGFE